MGFDLVYLFALSCGCSGLLCGWLLRNPISIVAPGNSAAEAYNINERKRLEQIARQLTRVTFRVAADVDEHQTKVQEVSDSLFSVEDEGAEEAVISAVEKLIEANTTMQLQLGEAQNHIRQQEELIENAVELALTDGLTGLNNRRAFDRHLSKRFQMKDFDGDHPTTLMLVDIDHFKTFNDTYGHRIGDEVLKHVSALLTKRFANLGFVARYGGEEFAVVFDDRTIEEIRDLADKARATISEHNFNIDDLSLHVSASAGLAQRNAEHTVTTWIEASDEALYAAKQNGRDCAYWMDGDVARRIGETDDAQTVPEQAPQSEPSDTNQSPDDMVDANQTPDAPSEPEQTDVADVALTDDQASEPDRPRTPLDESPDEVELGQAKDESDVEAVKRRSPKGSDESGAPKKSTKSDTAGMRDNVDEAESIPMAMTIEEEPADVGSVEALHKSTFPTFIKLQTERVPFSVVVLHVEAPEYDTQWEKLTQASIRGSMRGIDVNRIAFDNDKKFIICLPGVDELTAAHRCDAIRAAVCEMSYEHTGTSYHVTAASVCAEAAESFDEVLQRAAEAAVGTKR